MCKFTKLYRYTNRVYLYTQQSVTANSRKQYDNKNMTQYYV